MRRLNLLLLLMLLSLPAFAAKPAPKKAEEAAAPVVYADPWSLRKHYTIKLNAAALDYAEGNGELRVQVGDSKILSNTSFSITLGDGKVITPAGLPEAECKREGFTSEYGRGTHYASTFPATDGLQIIYRLTSFAQRPFLLLDLTVVNLGQAPVHIKEIQPLVIGQGGIQLGGNTVVTPLPIQARGGFLQVDPVGKPLYTFLGNVEGTQALAFGILPQGRTDSGVDLQSGGGAWQGAVYNRFSPGLALAPNERVTTDALWLTYALTGVEETNLQYSWTLSTNPHQTYDKPTPKGWITVEEEDSLGDLEGTAAAAKASGLKFALIPGGWETRPGSLQGAAPRYPREIAAAARQLRDANFAPGLTIDPLGFEDGGPGWSAKSADGKTWLNPGKEEARAFVQEKIRGLLKDGFVFFVVAPSTIPDEILAGFNLARAAADALALQSVAAAGAPVFPSFAATLEAGDPRWTAIQKDLQNLKSYSVVFAPTRLAFGEGGIGDGVIDSLKHWPGPIEVVGAPPSSVRSALQPVFRQLP